MTTPEEIEVVDSAGPALSRFSRQVREALRTLDRAFRGALDSLDVTWMPFTRRGPCVYSALYKVRTTNATATRLIYYPLRDNALSKIAVCITGRTTANQGYSEDLEIAYNRTGSTIAVVGAGALTRANRRRDNILWDTAVSTVAVGSDYYLIVTVTSTASTTMDWSAELRVQEQPSLPTELAA